MTKLISWITAFTLGSVAAFATTLFTDSTFSLSNYTATSLYNSDPGNATASFNQCNCGNPGQALQFLGFGLETDVLAIGFANNTFTYNPAMQGAIVAINFSIDKNISYNQVVSGTNTFRPLIEQDGIFYLSAIPGLPLNNATTTGYLTFSPAGLTAADFLSFNFSTFTFGSAHPNFSGDPMQFGLGQIYTVGLWNNLAVEVDYDNLNVSLNVAAPEPSSLLLIGAGLAGLAVRTRRNSCRPL